MSAGSNSGGVEGRHGRLVEKEEPFCLGGKVQRRTSWVEQALYREGLLRRAQKASLGIGDLRPLAIPFKEVGEILKNVKVKCADFRPAVLII